MKKLLMLSALLLAGNGVLAMEGEKEEKRETNVHRLIAEVAEMLSEDEAKRYDTQLVEVCRKLAKDEGTKAALVRKVKRNAGEEVAVEASKDDTVILKKGLVAALALLHDKVDLESLHDSLANAVNTAAANVKVGTNRVDSFATNLLQKLGAMVGDSEMFKEIYEGLDRATDGIDDVADAANEAVAGCCGLRANRNAN